ncbi:hypothetical protein [Deinococcus altitudinis]|uniref:hypothetical protein n=1 Tax=Deinococcus altitudinis TaxID=468914 RepID=UPI0038912C64
MSDTPAGNPQSGPNAGSDLAPERAELSLISNLSVGVPAAATVAEQGDAPSDLAERQAPHVPAPSLGGLSAAEVARMTGQDEETVSANNDLDRAEGIVADDED